MLQIEKDIPLTSKKLKIISTTVFIGVFFALIRAYFGDSLYHRYPFNSFLFNSEDRFADLYNMIKICSDNNPYFTKNPFSSNYFPVANTFFYVLSFLQNKALIAVAFLGGFLASYTYLLIKLLKHFFQHFFLEVFIVFFFSYALFFNIDRMNLEIYNFLLCLYWIYYRRTNKWLLAIFLLSISISLKLYTGVFVVLYLKERQYKEIFLIAGFVTLLTVFSLLTFKLGPINNIQGLLASLKEFTELYTTTDMGLHHNLSLFGCIKILVRKLFRVFTGQAVNIPVIMQHILPIYSAMCFLLFGGTIFVILKRNMAEWMNVFLLVAVFLLFPHVSFDYKLIFIYLPLIMFVKENTIDRYNFLYALVFGLLLIPHNYFYLFSDVSVAVIINPILILLLSYVIVFLQPKKISV